eukprot:6085953-Pyramimonas_sp.AAC.1
MEIDWEKQERAWRGWVQVGTQGNAGWARRWTKALDAWAPQAVPWKGSWTGRPSKVLDHEAGRLSQLWTTTGDRP